MASRHDAIIFTSTPVKYLPTGDNKKLTQYSVKKNQKVYMYLLHLFPHSDSTFNAGGGKIDQL